MSELFSLSNEALLTGIFVALLVMNQNLAKIAKRLDDFDTSRSVEKLTQVSENTSQIKRHIEKIQSRLETNDQNNT